MQLTINTFVREEESLMIATNFHKNELEGELAKQCQIVHSRSLSGIESQWMILVADSLWTYEKLSRARNGLAILIDISEENWIKGTFLYRGSSYYDGKPFANK